MQQTLLDFQVFLKIIKGFKLIVYYDFDNSPIASKSKGITESSK